jgi:hypothetical protein
MFNGIKCIACSTDLIRYLSNVQKIYTNKTNTDTDTNIADIDTEIHIK